MLQAFNNKKFEHQMFSDNDKEAFVTAVQKQIANAFAQFLNYKHYHWQTSEPNQRDLNIIFDEFANEVYTIVEDLSQSVRSTNLSGVKVKDFRTNASIKPSNTKYDVRCMIDEANSNSKQVIEELDALISKAKSGSPLRRLLEKAFKLQEKHQWWLQYILNKHRQFN